MILETDHPPKGTVRDWLDHRAQADGAAFQFCDDGSSLSWRDLRDEAGCLAAMVTAKGIAKGESVAILCPNGRDGVLATYGALYGGFRATMINLAAGPDAVAYALDHSDARFAFVHATAEPLFEQAGNERIEKLGWVAGDAPLHTVSETDHALLM